MNQNLERPRRLWRAQPRGISGTQLHHIIPVQLLFGRTSSDRSLLFDGLRNAGVDILSVFAWNDAAVNGMNLGFHASQHDEYTRLMRESLESIYTTHASSLGDWSNISESRRQQVLSSISSSLADVVDQTRFRFSSGLLDVADPNGINRIILSSRDLARNWPDFRPPNGQSVAEFIETHNNSLLSRPLSSTEQLRFNAIRDLGYEGQHILRMSEAVPGTGDLLDELVDFKSRTGSTSSLSEILSNGRNNGFFASLDEPGRLDARRALINLAALGSGTLSRRRGGFFHDLRDEVLEQWRGSTIVQSLSSSRLKYLAGTGLAVLGTGASFADSLLTPLELAALDAESNGGSSRGIAAYLMNVWSSLHTNIDQLFDSNGRILLQRHRTHMVGTEHPEEFYQIDPLFNFAHQLLPDRKSVV